MICLDLDGTLLKSDKTIDEMTIKTLNDLSDEGIRVVIATGRHYDFAKQLTNSLTDDRIIISNNGAAVFEVKTNTSILTDYIDNEIAGRIVNTAKNHGLSALVYVDVLRAGSDLFVFEGHNIDGFENTIVRDKNRIRIIAHEREIDNCFSIVFSGSTDELSKLEAAVNLEYSGKVCTHIMSSMYSQHGILEIMNQGVDKWSAISHFAEYSNIDKKSIIAFGDEVNDISMISNSGLGIAMKNALPEVKRVADFITATSNDDFGVYNTLSDIFKFKEL
ncbi:MAG: HAD family hydrolase [Tissierellia bacterium]|nr:HAD family hydrolase [Tissierellia bacterium]